MVNNKGTEDKYKINSYESLTQALSDTTSGAIQFIAQERGELKLRLSKGFKVIVCEDNHTVNVIIKYGNKSDLKFCRDYQEVYETILAVEDGTLKYEPYGKMDAIKKIVASIFAVIIFILGIMLLLVGGILLIAPIYSGIMDGFRPFYVYVALFFSTAAVLLGANALMYFGKKIYFKVKNSGR